MIRGLQGYTNRIMRHLSSNVSPSVSNYRKSYEDAVCTLNTLQSNAATVERIRQQKDAYPHLQLEQTVQMAERAGVSLDMIDKLSIIHVSGTKGKGSTCAFCESILRHHGYKTGFFSSPHLVEVRERIRINGRPLSREAFSSYFWDCYQGLEETKADHGGDMPAYFRFLTIMAFHVFLQEKVDVAIMEVGIGGQYDSTNIVRFPVVCGVTSLGLDHTSILGSTIEKIAWHKAGIFKPGVPAVTVPQPEGCLQVLKERAAEIGNPVYLAQSYDSYDWPASESARLGIAGDMQQVNASLALQLSNIWMQNHTLARNERLERYSAYTSGGTPTIHDSEKFKVTAQSKAGLELCQWAGRNQKMVRPGVTYYIDGAHTDRSIEQCVHWFLPEAKQEAKGKRSVARVLLFNLTGDRNPESLLSHLVECDFDYAVFCPNIPSVTTGDDRADQRNLMVTASTQLSNCTKNRNAWLKLLNEQRHQKNKAKKPNMSNVDVTNTRTIPEDVHNQPSAVTDCEQRTAVNQDLGKHQGTCVPFTKDSSASTDSEMPASAEALCEEEHCVTFSTIQESLQWLSQGGRDPQFTETHSPAPAVLREAEHLQVLCIGSLHLVGGLIGLLKPDINEA